MWNPLYLWDPVYPQNSLYLREHLFRNNKGEHNGLAYGYS